MDAPNADAPAPGRFPHRAVFAVVFALGSWLRIHGFDRPGLWIDEYGTWWVIAADGYAGVAARAWEVQGQSPFYYLIVRSCTDLFGLASWSLRLPSLPSLPSLPHTRPRMLPRPSDSLEEPQQR